MKKLKHNKLKNCGLIFEILTRLSVHEVMNKERPHSLNLIKKYFHSESQLFREMKLYELLSKQSNADVQELVNLAIESRKKLNEETLRLQKYNLIRDIKKKYEINEFFKHRVGNYKLLASIYKLFECDSTDNPEEYVNTKALITEHMAGKNIEKTKSEIDVIMEQTEGDPDLIRMGLRVMVEKFNDKYKNLLPKQKALLGIVINDDVNSQKVRAYINREIKYIVSELSELKKEIEIPATTIKVNESIQLIGEITKSPLIKDEHLSAMLKYYELVNVLRSHE